MGNSGIAFLWIGFFVFLSVSAVAGIVSEYKKRKLELEPLRAAIERGQQLDPAIIERLMAREPTQDGEINPLHLRIGGIITLALGIGLMPLAFMIAQIAPPAMFPIIGGGLLCLCIGVGLLISARVVERARTAASTATLAAGTQIIRGRSA